MKTMQDQINIQGNYFIHVIPFMNRLTGEVNVSIWDMEGGVRLTTKEEAEVAFPQWDGNAGFHLKVAKSFDEGSTFGYIYFDSRNSIRINYFVDGNIQDPNFSKILDAIGYPKDLDIKPEYPHNGYAKPVWWID